jgi:uncharacterized protein (DUF2164 family)/predicted amino acid-binding ACT domain protein
MLYIKSLSTKNFGLLADNSFDFSPTSNIIIGNNYAGKSTLITAIQVCIQGNSVVMGKADELVRAPAKNFALRLELSDGTVITRTKNDAAMYKGGRVEPYVVGSTAVNAELINILGLSKDDFSMIFTAKTEDTADFLSAEGITLQRLIERVLNLEELDNTHKALTTDVYRAGVMIKGAGDLPDLNELTKERILSEASLEALEVERQLLQDELAFIRQVHADAQAALTSKRLALDKANKNAAQALRAQGVAADLDTRIATFEFKEKVSAQDVADLRAKLDNLNWELNSVEKAIAACNKQMVEAKHLAYTLEQTFNRYVRDCTRIGRALIDVPGMPMPILDGREVIPCRRHDITVLEAAIKSKQVDRAGLTAKISDLVSELNTVKRVDITVQEAKADLAKQQEVIALLVEPSSEGILAADSREELIQKGYDLGHTISHIDKYAGMPVCTSCGQSTATLIPTDPTAARADAVVELAKVRQLLLADRRGVDAHLVWENDLKNAKGVLNLYQEVYDKRCESLACQRNVEAIQLDLGKAEAELNALVCGMNQESTTLADWVKQQAEFDILEASCIKNEGDLVLLCEQGEGVNLPSMQTQLLDLYQEQQDLVAKKDSLLTAVAEITQAERAYTENVNAYAALVNQRDVLVSAISKTTVLSPQEVAALGNIVTELEVSELDAATALQLASAKLPELQYNLGIAQTVARQSKEKLEAAQKLHADLADAKKLLDVGTQVLTAMTEVRSKMVADARLTLSQAATSFCSTVTEGEISEVIIDDKISFINKGIQFSRYRASGAQKAMMVIGIKLGLFSFLPVSLRVMLLDEMTATMSDTNSLAAMSTLQSMGIQTIGVTFREELADNIIQL